MKGRTTKMSANIISQKIEDLKTATSSSIAVDESCDINDIAQLPFLYDISPLWALKRNFSDYFHSKDEYEDLI